MGKAAGFWSLCFFAQWRLTCSGDAGAVWICHWCHWEVALTPGHSSWESNFVPSKEGECWSAVPSVGNIYSMGWSPPCGSVPWACHQCPGQCCTNTGTLLRLLQISLEFMWLHLQQGRKNHLHPPLFGNLGTLFWSVYSGTFGSCVFVPCFGSSLSPWVLVCFEYKPMGTCQLFIHTLGKLKLNKSVNKPGKFIWNRWSCADLFLPENLFRLECFGVAPEFSSQSSSRTPLLVSVLIHFIWPLHPPHTQGILLALGFLYRDIWKAVSTKSHLRLLRRRNLSLLSCFWI